MTRVPIRFIYSLVTILALANTGCEQNQGPSRPETDVSVGETRPVKEGPLLLLEDEPSLLLEDDGPSVSSNESGTDNSRCFVCHANYMEERIAVTHAKVYIGCAHCHGASDAHIADESWGSGGNGTAPDIMYPRDRINASCMTCHAKTAIDTPEHKPVFADSAEKKVCTDCHGDHRLTQRRCTWK